MTLGKDDACKSRSVSSLWNIWFLVDMCPLCFGTWVNLRPLNDAYRDMFSHCCQRSDTMSLPFNIFSNALHFSHRCRTDLVDIRHLQQYTKVQLVGYIVLISQNLATTYQIHAPHFNPKIPRGPPPLKKQWITPLAAFALGYITGVGVLIFWYLQPDRAAAFAWKLRDSLFPVSSFSNFAMYLLPVYLHSHFYLETGDGWVEQPTFTSEGFRQRRLVWLMRRLASLWPELVCPCRKLPL